MASFCHLPYKICKMFFRCAQRLILQRPYGLIFDEVPVDAYLALNGGASRSPKARAFPPCFKELRPLRRKVKEFPSRSQFFFPSIPIASLINSSYNWGISPVRNTTKLGSHATRFIAFFPLVVTSLCAYPNSFLKLA